MNSLDENINKALRRSSNTVASIILYVPFGLVSPMIQSLDKINYYLTLKKLTKTYHTLEGVPEKSKHHMHRLLGVHDSALHQLSDLFWVLFYPMFFLFANRLPINNLLFNITQKLWYQNAKNWLQNNPAKAVYFRIMPLILAPVLAVAWRPIAFVEIYIFWTCSIWSGLMLNMLANLFTQGTGASEWQDMKKFMVEFRTRQSEKDWSRYINFISFTSLHLAFDIVLLSSLGRCSDWLRGCTKYFEGWLAVYLVTKLVANNCLKLMLRLESYLNARPEQEPEQDPDPEQEPVSIIGNGVWIINYHLLHSLGSQGAIDHYHQQHQMDDFGVTSPDLAQKQGVCEP